MQYEFANFADDFVPFIAKNQFKTQIRKHAPLPKKDTVQEKIALIMNPMEMILTKDHVKVLIQIIPKSQTDTFVLFPPMDTMEHYKLLQDMSMEMQKDLMENGVQPLA